MISVSHRISLNSPLVAMLWSEPSRFKLGSGDPSNKKQQDKEDKFEHTVPMFQQMELRDARVGCGTGPVAESNGRRLRSTNGYHEEHRSKR